MIWTRYFTSAILNRGRIYWNNGRVGKLQMPDDKTCTSVVRGTHSYHVSARLLSNDKLELDCDCPYAEDGNHCKHEAALLYKIEDEKPAFLHDGNVEAGREKAGPERATKTKAKQNPEYLKDPFGKYPEDVFFPLDPVLKQVRILQNTFEDARKLVEEGKVWLSHSEIRFRAESDSYLSQDKQSVVLSVSCSYRISDDDSGTVELNYGRESVSEFQCKPAKGSDTNNYYGYNRGVADRSLCTSSNTLIYNFGYFSNTRKPSLCVHKTAALIITDRYVREHNPGDHTDLNGAALINRIREDEAQQTRQRNQTPVVKSEPVDVLLSYAGFDSDYLYLEVKVGRTRYYIVRNVSSFLSSVGKGETVMFGKTLKVDFSTTGFTESGKRCLDFMDMVPEYCASGRYLIIGREYLDAFFDLFRNHGIHFEGGAFNLIDGDISFDSEISDYIVDGRKEGISITMAFPSVIRSPKALYTPDIENRTLKRTPLEGCGPLRDMIVNSSGESVTAVIGLKEMHDFRYRILPVLQNYGNVDTRNLSDSEYQFTDPPEFTFNLDYENKAVVLRCSVSYGDRTYDLKADKAYGYDFDRDHIRENKILKEVRKLFPDEYQDYWSLSGDDVIFAFLYEGMDVLFSMGTVNATASFTALKMRRKPRIGASVSLEGSLLDIDLDLDGLDISELSDILDSYRKRKAYHRLKDGTFMVLDSDDIGDLATLFENLRIGKRELVKEKLRIPAYRALYLNTLMEQRHSLSFSGSESFRNVVRDMTAPIEKDWQLPKDLKADLRPYQKDGFLWLRTISSFGFGGILADEMGLGKTVQMLSLILSLNESGEKGCSLVVCPASLIYNWKSEIMKFAPTLTCAVVAGKQAERERIISEHDSYDVLVTSYDLIKRDMVFYRDVRFLVEVIDEAQYIKNHFTEASKAVKVIDARLRFAMTGTPIENRISELWSIFDFLMPGFLYGRETFRKDFEIPIMRETDGEAANRLKMMTGPFILRRLKTNVLKDLPEKIEEIKVSKLTGKQRRLYDANVLKIKNALAKTDNSDFDKSKIEILSELTRLRQLCCDPSLIYDDYDGESAKRVLCMDLIESAIDGGNKVLVFSQFTSMLSLLHPELEARGIRYYEITGSTKSSDRLTLAQQFNKDDVPVFLVSLKAGGTGLNLTGANIVIHYDPWWNTAVQNQATDRAHRIGQQKVVTVYKLIAEDTIEEKILLLQKDKSNLADEILSGSVQGIGSLSREALMEILS